MAAVKPSIDDQFWFDWSKTQIEGALERRLQAFEKLQNLVLWLWGIYTSFAAVGFTLSSKSLELGPTLLIALASGLLIAVYWACVWGQLPISIEFDPRSPTEIKQAHLKSITTKDMRLRIALGLSVVAAIAVALALVVAGTAQSKATPGLETSGKVMGDRVQIAITATIKPKTDVVLEVFSRPNSTEWKSVFRKNYRSTEGGDVQVSVEVAKEDPFKVVVYWIDDELERSMSRLVRLSKPNSKAEAEPAPSN
jgi:hypothetical protein